MSIEAMKQARDFISRLKFADAEPEPEIVMAVLDQAIAEAEKQEPVAWRYIGTSCLGHGKIYGNWNDGKPPKVVELANKDKNWSIELAYTHPPKREWVGLTDEEVGKICGFGQFTSYSTQFTLSAVARAIEAKLKQKNGYAEEKNT